MAATRTGRRGPAAGATREQVLACARAHFLAGRRVDVQAVAAESGVGRATVYRWFGSREQLVGEAMTAIIEQRMIEMRERVGGHGAPALLHTFDRMYHALATSAHVRWFIEHDRATAAPVITSSRGVVHPKLRGVTRRLIQAEVDAGTYEPRIDVDTLSYVIVRMAEGFLLHVDEDAIPNDLDRLREVLAALLGIDG